MKHVLDQLKPPLPTPIFRHHVRCLLGLHEWVYTRVTHRIRIKWPHRICLYCGKTESYSLFTVNEWKPAEKTILISNYCK
jgi:hypothetical protein